MARPTPGDAVGALKRELGREIRRLRQARDLSQTALAQRINYHRVSVTQVEMGRQDLSRQFVERLEDALGAPGELLAIHDQLVAARIERQGAGSSAVPAPAVAPSLSAVDEGDILNRRLVLRSAAALAATAPLGIGSPTLSAAAATDSAPIEHFRRMRKVLIDSDNLFGPAGVIPAVYEQVQVLQRLRRSTRGADGEALLHIQIQFGECAAWLHQDQGDHETARFWTDRALEWSHMAREPELTTSILARKAQLAGDMQDAMTAIGVAEAAADMAPPGTRMAAVATTYAAHGYALAGDRAACARAYGQAHELLAGTHVDPESTWGVWLDASYIEVQRARSQVVLGNYAAAAEGFEHAIDELPDGYPRDRGVYLARAALAHAGVQDADQAAALGMQALAIGAETGSGRITAELRQLDGILGTWDTEAGDGFRDAMRSARLV